VFLFLEGGGFGLPCVLRGLLRDHRHAPRGLLELLFKSRLKNKAAAAQN
jgi:hypothetical protein